MSPHQQQYYQHVLATLNQVFLTQSAEVEQAAALFAECVKANGIIHGFGSGHSFAAAVELAGRAGGWSIPKPLTSSMDQPAGLIR